MKPHDWRRVEELFHAALQRAPAEREAFLRETCGGDEELRREVESLLAEEGVAERLMEEPAAGAATQKLAVVRGTRLGPYEVIDLIGAGGMGEVYRARDTRLGRDVAIKVLPEQVSHDVSALARLNREARAVAALSHPHIAALHDIGEHEGTHYLVMELLEGETLASRLRRGALPEKDALRIGAEIADALGAAHAHGIVHRDVKPANVMLTRAGVKLLDFGLARLQRKAGSPGETATAVTGLDAGVIAGTLPYMAPEQVRGQAFDARTDIFALGAVLYEMLSGRRAFGGGTAADTMTAILTQDPGELSGPGLSVPASLERIVRRCLEKDPEERFQSARDVAFALKAESGASRSRMEPAPAAAGPRRRWLTAAAIGLPLLLAAAGLGLLYGRKLGERPLPKITQLTFRRGLVDEARFTADGQTVVYSAFWDGNPPEIFTTRVESPESRSLGLPPARLLSVSSTGELAILLKAPGDLSYGPTGTLARVPLSGGEPRRVLDDVLDADWSPDGRELAIIRRVKGEFQLEYPIGNVLGRSGRYLSIRTSPRGDGVAVVDNAALGERQGITAYDRVGRKTPVQTPPQVLGLAWPSGDALWFTAGESFGYRSVWRGKPTGPPREVYRDVANLTLHDASSDGRLLVHHGFERVGVKAKAPGEKGERDLAVFMASWAIDLSADGSQVLIGDGDAPVQAYVRPTRAGPSVRLGEGTPLALSPAGTWALVASPDPHPRFILTPTGPGEPRTLPSGRFERIESAWFVDEGRLLIDGSSGGRRSRGFLVDLSGGEPRPVTPEGIVSVRGSYRDGAVIGVAADGTLARYPLQGGDPQPMAARLPSGAIPLRVSGDGRFLFVARERLAVPYRIDRLELATGRLTAWKTLRPEDATGVNAMTGGVLTPDGEAYAYTYERDLHDLYLVEGLRP
jgi:eukaryotic-like serine/threonine-protein kinase